MSGINETFCVCIDEEKDVWCAVLGNHYPNFPKDAGMQDALKKQVELGISSMGGVFFTQRLCDHNNVQYRYVLLRAPTCPECLRVKKLMVEFARPKEKSCLNGKRK